MCASLSVSVSLSASLPPCSIKSTLSLQGTLFIHRPAFPAALAEAESKSFKCVPSHALLFNFGAPGDLRGVTSGSSFPDVGILRSQCGLQPEAQG